LISPTAWLKYGIVAFGLVGCLGKVPGGTQMKVVATVNDQEIAMSASELGSPAGDAVSGGPEFKERAIELLVSEELLVQGALNNQVDRDPAVILAIDTARRRVLARSFAERYLYPKSSISDLEIDEFYKSYPILFEKRRRFELSNYTIATASLNDRLQAELDQVHSVPELQKVLHTHEIHYSSQTVSITPDQLPVDKLGDFGRANAGDLMIAEQGDGKTMLMYIESVEEATPMSFDLAKPYIALYLVNLRNRKAVSDYLKQARSVSKIDYLSTASVVGLEPAAQKPAGLERSPVDGASVKANRSGLYAISK